MKKKLSLVMVALVALAAFATTMSLQMARRAVSELTVISEATTWDFSSGVTLSSTHEGDLKYTGDDKTTEHIYANIDELTFAETFKADALAFTGEYPFRSNSKKFAQNGTLHFKTSVAGKIVVKFSDTGSSASASAVKRYLVVNGTQTDYWTSRENNGEEGYPAQLNVTTDEIEVPAGDVTIAGSSAIIVSYVAFTPDAADPEPATKEVTMQYTGTTTTNMTGNNDAALVGLNADEWSVVGAKGASNYFPGLNKDGTIRLYWNASGSNTITVSSLKNATINSITLDLKSSNNNISVTVNGNPVEGTDGTYAINSTSFVLGNANTSNAQVHINSVKITYTEGGAEPEPVDPGNIEISPASGDIYAALAEATEGKEVKSITINLTKDVTYTVSAPLITATDFTINGNGATIDASALFANMIQWKVKDAEDTQWTKADVAISDVTVKGLNKALFYSAGKYYYGDFTLTNSVIEQAADATTFDYTKGSTALNFTVTGSTIYAATATTKSLYSSQSGQKATEYASDAKQIFTFHNNTMYNLAKTKNFFTHRQSNQKWLTYDVQNNIFVDCGKSGQTIKGLNGGSQGANPTWIIMGNTFNFEGADTSAGEVTGDAEEPVKDNVAGVVTFTDAATGNFSGAFVATEGAFVPSEMPGDPRWTITATASTVPAPEIDGQEKFIGKQNITLSCEMENTKIYYTTDGNDPTIESTLYAEPFEISETTTVKAIAVFAFAGKNYASAVASKTLTLQTTFATIAELIQLPDGTGFGYTEDVKVVAQAKAGEDTYTYIKDESGATVIFDAGSAKTPAEAVGKKIAKDWVGTVSVYHGLFELVPAAALTLAEGEAQEVKYPVVDFDYVTAEHAAEVVMLSGVTYSFVNEEELTITKGEQQIAALNKFGLNPGFAKKDVEYNIIGAINVYDEKVEFWPVAFVEKPTVDIEVNPEPGTDISEAIAEASKGHFVRNITINLQVADGAAPYTITQSIVAPASIRIFGNGAGIDASALEGALVTTPEETPEEWITGLDFFMDNVAIKGLSKALFATAGKNRAYEAFSVNNSVIEVAGDVTVFDFTKGSTALIFNVSTSTIYAPKATTKSLYSSQGGQKATELDENATQHFNFLGSTFYNLATGKNFFSHRQSNQKWLTYSAHSNIFVNCGKNGQTIAGMNGGQTGSNPTWSIANNAFNFVTVNEDGSFVSEDTGAKEDNKDADEPITATIAGSVYFQDAANTNFAIDATCAAATPQIGDTRWGTWEPTHYTLAVSEEALQYADITVQPFALEDEVVKVDVQEHNGFKMTELIAKVGAQTKLTVTDNSFIMPPANVGIDATFQKVAADYELAPAAGTDIAAALEGLIIRNLKLTLAEGGAYTLTKSIELGGNLEIIGNGATIDASGIEVTTGEGDAAVAAAAPFIILSGSETFAKKADETDSDHYLIASATIKDVTVKGLKDAFIKDNQKTLLEKLTIENAIIEMPDAQKNVIDFSDKGYVGEVVVNKSTIYAPTKNTGFFAQYGSRPKNVNGDWLQQFDVQNSTIVNIANGKNFCDLKQNGTAQNVYTLKNNIFADCGKAGQVVVGFNKGQASNAPVWNVDGNLFMLNGANNNAAEVAKAGKHFVGDAENVTEEDIVQNSVEAIVTFAAVATGDFNYSYVKDPSIAELPAIGDPRWTATVGGVAYAINVDEAIENGTVTASKSWSAADETIKLTVTPDEGYELESITVKMGAAEIILEEDNSFIMPAADVTVSATFIAVPKLYIIGGPKDWNLADMTELKYNLETQTYELDYAPTATAYFAFADKQFTAEEAAAEGAWDVFNATNRIALGEGDIEATLNEPVDLKKVNGTIILKAGTYKISVTKDLKVTIAGEPAPEPTVEKLFIMGTATAKGWDGTTEMTFNEADQAFEYELENADKIYITFGDAEFTDWGDFNANHRFAIAGGDNVAPVGEEFTLVKVEGTLVLEAGAYKISVTKDLKCTITAVTPTGINAIAVDKLDNAVIYNLQGQRVEKSQAKGGVFIVNGKKVAIK